MINSSIKDSLKFASIDIGSNAMRLLFCRVIEDKDSTKFIKESLFRMPLRLGHDAFTDGVISEENSMKLIDTIRAFQLMIKAYDPIAFRSCATAALRTALNGKKLVDEINAKVNVDLEIISGNEEARIIMANHIEDHLDPKKNYLYVDVGGGSTEISFISNRQKVSSKSFPIGSVRLLENQVTENDWADMEKWINKNMSKHKGQFKAIGSGGNINKIFSMSQLNRKSEIDISTIQSVLDKIKPLSVQNRIIQLGLRPDRADVILHAGKIYESIMRWSNSNEMIVPQSGLPDGIIHELYNTYKNKDIAIGNE